MLASVVTMIFITNFLGQNESELCHLITDYNLIDLSLFSGLPS